MEHLLRRKVQLLNINPDLNIYDIRGNVDTRISKMLNGEYDGLVMAAGIERLDSRDVTEYFDTDQMLPAPGQGAISVEVKKKIMNCLKCLKIFVMKKQIFALTMKDRL